MVLAVAVAAAAPAQNGSLALSSVQAVFDRMSTARTIVVAAFALQPDSPMVAHLLTAADRGARVSVALSRGFGMYVAENAATAAALTARGVRVHVLDFARRPTHLKAAVLDGELYLSDRNWSAGSDEQIVLHDTVPGDRTLVERAILGVPGHNDHLWTKKADALAAEARVLKTRRSHKVRISSESFGPDTPVFDALIARAAAGDTVEVLVAPAEYRQGTLERAALQELRDRGVRVALSSADEKFATDGDAVWLGSANATRGTPNQIDFGLVTIDANVARRLAAQFDVEWRRSEPLESRPP